MTQFLKTLTVAGALLVGAASADAYARAFLKAQWVASNGDRMCRYDNGTVLNVRYRICPMSIEG